ncbi:MAG: hypothetical protein ACLGHN_14910 [Bacteriovoracia bacterium]
MNNESLFNITREKHLDHMVKVVPFIVFCYAIQSFLIMKIDPGPFATISLSVLGGFLALMITAFVTYDLKHQVFVSESHLEIKFLFYQRKITFEEITELTVMEPGQSFSNLVIKTHHGKYTFYFIDDAEKLKTWIQEKKHPVPMAA